MKLILRQYLADLPERDELDAVVPELLSEIGFNVLSRPARGMRQLGVDVAAVGPDEDDKHRRKLFLFTIKPGDVTRGDWNGTLQALRPSLEEILDAYIPHRIPEQYRHLQIAVCVCMGGNLAENVQELWQGFTTQRTTVNVCFRMWNGDRLADLLLSGVLRRELVDSKVQSTFEKAVAMVAHPDVSYEFFRGLTDELLSGSLADKHGIARLRQVYVCLWVLFVWARGAGNLDAPFRASEYAVLRIWGFCRSAITDGTMPDAASDVLRETLRLHIGVGSEFVHKLEPYAGRRFALSMAVDSQSWVDVNLALFEQLGRVSLAGLLHHWQASIVVSEDDDSGLVDSCRAERDRMLAMAIDMVNANSILQSPLRDDFAIEIGLFLVLAQACDSVGRIAGYVLNVAHRVAFALKRRGRYPVTMVDYHDLVGHPVDGSNEYFAQSTRGSVLYPLLVAWLDELGERDVRNHLVVCIGENLSHTTQQVWVPDALTDELLWEGKRDHGVGLWGLPLSHEPAKYREFLNGLMANHGEFNALSTTRAGMWPLFLMACRHYRLPLPPHFWFVDL